MALKDSRGGREYDKFVADATGDTAIRTQATVKTTVETTGGTIAVPISVSGTGVGTEVLGPTSVAGHDRISLQFFNVDAAVTLTFKVWGSLVTEPEDPVPTIAAGTKWTQIGDDVTVTASGTTAGSFNAFKAISTTPMEYISVTCVPASGTRTAAVYMLAD